MRLLFKFSGLAVVFTVCVLWGLLKSLNLKKRCERLSVFSRSIYALGERILTHSGEIESILPGCFSEKLVYIYDGRVVFEQSFLKKEDILLLSEFFEGLGLRDTKSECDRIKLYINLIAKKIDEADSECEKLSKLYNTLGILCGIFICIFLL